MAVKRFTEGEAVDERSDAEYAATFIEAAVGQPAIDDAAILTITATLKDVSTDAVINSRDNQNVKNANGGVLASDGTFTLTLGTNDNVILNTPPTADVFEGGWKRAGQGLEEHELTLKVTYTRTGGGTGTLNHAVRFFVQDLAGVT